MEPNTERRVRILDVSPDVLMALCQKPEAARRLFVTNPIPDDARIVEADYNQFRCVVMLVIESQSFDPVSFGDEIPHVYPQPTLRVEYEAVPHD